MEMEKRTILALILSQCLSFGNTLVRMCPSAHEDMSDCLASATMAPLDSAHDSLVVQLQAGTYTLSHTLYLKWNYDKPLHIHGESGSAVKLIGSSPLLQFASKPPIHEGPLWRVMLDSNKVSRWSISTKALSQASFPLLLHDEQKMRLAETPDTGWAQISPTKSEDGRWTGLKFTVKANPLAAKAHPPFTAYGFLAYEWHSGWISIIGSNADSLIIGSEFVDPYPMNVPLEGRIRFTGAKMFLDHEDEYWYDSTSHQIYLLTDPSAVSIAVNASPLISIDDSRNIRMSSLSIGNSAHSGIEIRRSSMITLDSLQVSNVNTLGIAVWGGTEAVIDHSVIQHIGSFGVYLEGGDRKTLKPARHIIRNSRILHFGERFLSYHSGISLEGVGNIAENSEIAYGPHVAVQFSGNDHEIKGNDIHDACLESSDMGAIYNGKDWGAQGNRVMFNHIHAIGRPGKKNTVGVYLDDGLAGIFVKGNQIEHVDYGILIGGGRDNHVLDNRISDTRIAIWIDNRVVNRAGLRLMDRLSKLHMDTLVWYKAYPWMRSYSSDQKMPVNTIVQGNRYHSNQYNLKLSNSDIESTISDSANLSE